MRRNWLKTGVILTAGWGTRRLPITKTIEKNMLPVGNRPLVDYALRDAFSVGIEEVYIVVADAEHSQIRDYYAPNAELEEFLRARGKTAELEQLAVLPAGVKLHFVTQKYSGKYGAAVALVSALEAGAIAGPVWVCMGDNFIWNPGGATAAESMARAAEAYWREAGVGEDAGDDDLPDVAVMLGVEVPKREVFRYGVLSVDGNANLTGIVEKPKVEEAPSNLISPGYYLFSPQLVAKTVRYVHENEFGDGREYVVPDPIAEFIADGGVMKVAQAEGKYLDGGNLEGWLEANRVVGASGMKA